MFSRRIVTDLLRGELGFGGVTITDTLAAPGVASPAAAVRATRAGVDLLLYVDERSSARGYRACCACGRGLSPRGPRLGRADRRAGALSGGWRDRHLGVLWTVPRRSGDMNASARSDLLVLPVLAAVPVAAQATDSHAPGRPRRLAALRRVGDVAVAALRRGHARPPAAHRPRRARRLDDQRTLGQLARKRGFRSQRALAQRLVAARGGHMSPAPCGACSSAARSTRSRRRTSPATSCSTSTTRPRSRPRRGACSA